MTKASILLLLTLLPRNEPLTDKVDTIEVNHLYDTSGKLTFKQAILWIADRDGVRCVAWRLLKHETQNPRIDRRRGCWRMQWSDNGTWRRVYAHRRIVTHTAYDPEIADRAILPVSQRRGLMGEGKSAPTLVLPPRMNGQ